MYAEYEPVLAEKDEEVDGPGLELREAEVLLCEEKPGTEAVGERSSLASSGKNESTVVSAVRRRIPDNAKCNVCLNANFTFKLLTPLNHLASSTNDFGVTGTLETSSVLTGLCPLAIAFSTSSAMTSYPTRLSVSTDRPGRSDAAVDGWPRKDCRLLRHVEGRAGRG